MRQLFAILFLFFALPLFSQVEVKIVNRTGNFLFDVEIEGQRIGSMKEDASATVLVPKIFVSPNAKVSYRGKVLSTGKAMVCGNEYPPRQPQTSGKVAYALLVLKNDRGEPYLALSSQL